MTGNSEESFLIMLQNNVLADFTRKIFKEPFVLDFYEEDKRWKIPSIEEKEAL